MKKHAGASPNRSFAGNGLTFLLLLLLGLFMLLPFVYVLNNAFKPMDELFVFPPKLFVRNPTLDNFYDMSAIMANSDVHFFRYFFNTTFITVIGTAGHILISSLAAFMLAKYNFPFKKVMFQTIVLSLMFAAQVTAIPNYLTISDLGWIDTYLAVIVPAFSAPLGLFLMKQFIETMVPDSLIESADMDGAGILTIFFRIVMPLVKPAWLTIMIFSIQSLWNSNGGNFILSEQLKPLQYALQQILSGGIVRTGASSAVSVIMMIVPIVLFISAQSRVIETMSTSGLKE